MKRLFSLLNLIGVFLLLVSCATPKEQPTPTLTVHGAQPATTPINDTVGINGAIKIAFSDTPIKIVESTCGDTTNQYVMAVSLVAQVTLAGSIRVSIGVRTNDIEEYRWYVTDMSDLLAKRRGVRASVQFSIEVPTQNDVYMKLIAVGGDSLGDHSSQHYAEYTPNNGAPSIPKTQCAMSP